MQRTFTVEEARALLPELIERTAEVITLRADLAELGTALRRGDPSPLGGVAEVKALEAGLHEIVAGFDGLGLQVKGLAPVLLDFPAVLDGREVLLCWLEGETELSWYHEAELGFLGRRRLNG